MAVDDASSASSDAMPDGADFAEFFDIEVDEFARLLAFVAPNRFSRLQGTQPCSTLAGAKCG